MSELFRPAEYFRPDSIEEAIRLLNDYAGVTKVLAGGTDLMVKRPSCDCLLDITKLGLNYVTEENGRLKIGATTTMDRLTESPLVKEKHPALTESARTVGSLGIRSMATIGGNICHASPSADTVPVLIALSAHVRIVGLASEREILLEDFFVGPGKTQLKSNELMVEVVIPQSPSGSGAAFVKHTRHQTKDDLAVVNAASKLTINAEGRCLDAVICLGAVASKAIPASQAEQSLTNEILTPSRIEQAAIMAQEETRPMSDVRGGADYRRAMSAVLVKKTLIKAWNRAKGKLA